MIIPIIAFIASLITLCLAFEVIRHEEDEERFIWLIILAIFNIFGALFYYLKKKPDLVWLRTMFKSQNNPHKVTTYWICKKCKIENTSNHIQCWKCGTPPDTNE